MSNFFEITGFLGEQAKDFIALVWTKDRVSGEIYGRGVCLGGLAQSEQSPQSPETEFRWQSQQQQCLQTQQ